METHEPAAAPTPFAAVNQTLAALRAQLPATLGDQPRGIYVVGSLALRAYDPRTSDIDLIVVLEQPPGPMLAARLAALHAGLSAAGAPIADQLEVVYVDPAALRRERSHSGEYPQIERGGAIVVAPLEDGWVFQRAALRDRGIVLHGPDPQAIAEPADAAEMRAAAKTIARGWLATTKRDPDWLRWLAEPTHQRFVVLTLCRMLHSLRTGAVVSKPAAAAWAIAALPPPWPELVRGAIERDTGANPVTQRVIRETLAIIRFVADTSAAAGR